MEMFKYLIGGLAIIFMALGTYHFLNYLTFELKKTLKK